LLINVPHQLQRVRAFLNRVVVPIGSSKVEQRTLASNAQLRMPRDNPLPFVFNRARQFFYPVLFHFQPANFLVQFDLNFFVLLIALGASCAKEFSRP